MKHLLIVVLIIIPILASAQKSIQLGSPGGRIKFSFSLSTTGPSYSISFKKNTIIKDASLALSFKEGGEFKTNLKTGTPVFREGVEKYELITGKTSQVNQ